MTTYTYPLGTAGVPISGMSAEDVAIERLTHDGHEYKLQREPDGTWQFYCRNPHSHRPFSRAYAIGKLLYSCADTEDDAWAELAERIVFADWRDVPIAMTDDKYRAMVAEIAAEDDA